MQTVKACNNISSNTIKTSAQTKISFTASLTTTKTTQTTLSASIARERPGSSPWKSM